MVHPSLRLEIVGALSSFLKTLLRKYELFGERTRQRQERGTYLKQRTHDPKGTSDARAGVRHFRVRPVERLQ